MKKISTNNSSALKKFIADIKAPYNVTEFNRLELDADDEFLDIVTCNVMNFPVTLHGYNFDFDTLDRSSTNLDGTKANPFTRELYTWDDVMPNIKLYNKIKDAINEELELRKEIIGKICRAAEYDKVDRIKKLFATYPKIKVNDEYANGYTPLHYACMALCLNSAKYLIDIGADLDLLSCDKFTPFQLIHERNSEIAAELKQYLLDSLQRGIARQDTSCHIRYAKYLLNNLTFAQDSATALDLLNQAGDLGDLSGYVECGNIYAHGLYNTIKNVHKAVIYYDKAIEGKNKAATIKKIILELSEAKPAELDIKILQDITDNVALFEPEAQLLYAMSFKIGFEVSLSNYNYVKYLKYSADQGLALSQNIYAHCCLGGNIIPKNLEEAAKYLRMAADQGLARAQHIYAICCLKGIGINANFEEAAKYSKMAADQGLAGAQNVYAICCFKGIGINTSVEQAKKYFKMAADQGDSDAQYNYAIFNSITIPANIEEAVKYFKMAADQGDADAQYEYALCCANGLGTSLNLLAAAKYYKMAADQGHVRAQNNYAICCAKGKGVTLNLIEAAQYYKMAADQGGADAQYNYAVCCTLGTGIAVNIEEAEKYYKMAANQGCTREKIVPVTAITKPTVILPLREEQRERRTKFLNSFDTEVAYSTYDNPEPRSYKYRANI